MAILKCKMCGGDLNIEEEVTVWECEYCGSKQTVPVVDDEKKLKLYDRANKLRSNCEFDKAAGVYENIVSEFSDEAEGYWGLILCRYGIEYVDDPITGKKIPTCHRSSFDSIMDDEDFEMVMENSDSVSRVVYREEAKYIEEIRKGIIEVSGKEEPYDIFICYKETDENGERTLDSVLAQDVYEALTDKGYRVFFSRISLEDKLGVEYEPYIFAALNSAKVMLAFGTSYDYYNAVWVKNEWSRYLKLMAADKSKHLIPCFKNVDAYDIPKEFARLQAQDMGKVGAVQDLLRGIEKLLGETKSKSPVLQDSAIINSIGMSTLNANSSAFLKRGTMALEDGEWDKANEFFEQVLNINPEDGWAYWGELLAELECSNVEEVAESVYEDLLQEVEGENVRLELEDYYTLWKDKHICLDVLDANMVEVMFSYPFEYFSEVSSVEQIMAENAEEFALSDNKLYQRAMQYADASLKVEFDKLVHLVEQHFNQYLVQVKSDEAQAIEKMQQQASEYYHQLENALESADVVMKPIQENYKMDVVKWKEEESEISKALEEWERLNAQYEVEYASWLNRNEEIFNQWHKDKTAYATERNRLLDLYRKLNDDKRVASESFMGKGKVKAIDEELLIVKKQLLQLVIPPTPEKEAAPLVPIKPQLRDYPTISAEDKEKVLEAFISKVPDEAKEKFDSHFSDEVEE